MSTQNRSTVSEVRSNILGVTGLSRAVLADLFRRRGLFGRDSQLSHSEQAVVQSALPTIAGLAAPSAPKFLSPRLKALADYSAARVAGGDASAEYRRLVDHGLSGSAIREAAITIDNVRVVFGTTLAAAKPVTVGERSTAPQYARAA